MSLPSSPFWSFQHNVDGQPDGEFSLGKAQDMKRQLFGLLQSPRESHAAPVYSTGLEAHVAYKRGESAVPIPIERKKPLRGKELRCDSHMSPCSNLSVAHVVRRERLMI